MFGGPWTQHKLEVLSKYLRAYLKIFHKNVKAKFFRTTYVDAFAGTGVIPRPPLGLIAEFFPAAIDAEEEFRKGSVRRALELDPPFDRYVFIEKDPKKCEELQHLKEQFSDRDVKVINEDANEALLKWCVGMNTRHERAVVFLDPFGASVEWRVIEAIANTKAVDLWILFPYGAINRMLVSDRKPEKAWADRLTRVFGTEKWGEEFYSTTLFQSILDPNELVERVDKVADQQKITEFLRERLRSRFVAVSEPGFLRNSKGLLFVLLFAAGNEKGATTGLGIANDLIHGVNRPF